MMQDNPSVNRYLRNKAMDLIDHALGRPVHPMQESYRNHFATDADSDYAREFSASPFWVRGGSIGKDFVCFHVTDEGRKALAAHLKAIGSAYRLYEIRFGGFTSSIAAETPAKAKYKHWLRVSDCADDLTFGEYQRGVKVRLAGAA